MDEENGMTAPEWSDVAGRLSEATQALASALQNINANFESLHAKIDRIVAAVEGEQPSAETSQSAEELRKANHDLQAQAARARRKTLSPIVTTLLAKEGVDGEALIEGSLVEKALAGLSVEQRIAVKAELARAGVLV